MSVEEAKQYAAEARRHAKMATALVWGAAFFVLLAIVLIVIK